MATLEEQIDAETAKIEEQEAKVHELKASAEGNLRLKVELVLLKRLKHGRDELVQQLAGVAAPPDDDQQSSTKQKKKEEEETALWNQALQLKHELDRLDREVFTLQAKVNGFKFAINEQERLALAQTQLEAAVSARQDKLQAYSAAVHNAEHL